MPWVAAFLLLATSHHSAAQNSNQSTNLKSSILSGDKNIIATAVSYAVVAGGYANSARSNASYSFVGSGSGNIIQQGAQYSVLTGGSANTVQSGAMHSALAGGFRNSIFSNADSATISGGFRNEILADADYAVIAGGHGNMIGPRASSSGVLGGVSNVIQTGVLHSVLAGGNGNYVRSYAHSSFLGGGFANIIQTNATYSVIAGGRANFVQTNASHAVVAGGLSNAVGGEFATIPGGARGKANHRGAFVWSGAGTVDTASTNAASFTVRAPGGVRFITTTNTSLAATNNGVILQPGGNSWAALSDSNAKTAIKQIDARAVLRKLASLPVTEWQYKGQPDRHYIGPMAQDFHAAFGLGYDDKTIATADTDGVMYAAIQGLVEEIKLRDEKIAELEERSLEQRSESKAEMAELRAMLHSLEERLGPLPPAP